VKKLKIGKICCRKFLIRNSRILRFGDLNQFFYSF